MNDEELQENFCHACLKYAMDNGGVPDIDAFLLQRVLNEEEEISIASWTHSSTQPTTTDLKAYSVSDLDEVKTITNCINRMREGKTCVCTTPIGETIKPYADEGQLRYCHTDNVLKIKLSNTWVPL